MKKIKSLLLIIILLVVSFESVYAAPATIEFGPAGLTQGYIAETPYSELNLKDGTRVFCLEAGKTPTENVTAHLINSSRVNGGIQYILNNSYPTKSITGDSGKDFYITQTAIWWYLDKTTGSYNLGNGITSIGSDPYNLRGHIINLVNEAYNHRNDPITSSYGLDISTNNKEMSLSDKYYVSNEIKAKTNNVSSYNVELSGATNNALIVKSNNEVFTYKGSFTVKADETFRIKVPVSEVKETEKVISLTASAKVNDSELNEYQPTNRSMQNVVYFQSKPRTIVSTLKLEVSSSKVTIEKIDSNTKKPLAGATLVLKDESGKEITTWTSTVNAHIIRNLPNGTYTITETNAPSGYLINNNVTKFTVSDTNNNISIKIENAPKEVVVNITKIDQETKQPLAGAVLVVKDSTGKEIARFTTTTSPYVLTNLANGTYTVEEISAPSGYIRNTDKISFTIDDNHLSHQINFINAKEVEVPNTVSFSSVTMLLMGILITSTGLVFIHKHGKA